MTDESYYKIVSYYEACLEKHGDNYHGVDYTRKEQVDITYQVLLDVIRPVENNKIKLLDFGCGNSLMYEYIRRNKLNHIEYTGLDISKKFIELSKRKFPSNTYYCLDILKYPDDLPTFDYIIMASVFTEKRELSFDEMYKYFTRVLKAVFVKARLGIAFNVFSKQVDWERDILFHLPMDMLAKFLKENLTRYFVFRHDYGLYMYTVYIYKNPAVIISNNKVNDYPVTSEGDNKLV